MDPCRICLEDDGKQQQFCKCIPAHQECLLKQYKYTSQTACEICNEPLHIQHKKFTCDKICEYFFTIISMFLGLAFIAYSILGASLMVLIPIFYLFGYNIERFLFFNVSLAVLPAIISLLFVATYTCCYKTINCCKESEPYYIIAV